MQVRFAILSGLVCLNLWAVPGADLAQAPRSFSTNGKTAIPVDFQYVTLNMEFDPAAGKARATCAVTFYAEQAGYPFLDLVPNPTAVSLDGRALGAGGLPAIQPPGGTTTLRMVNESVPARSEHLLEVSYDVPSADVTFSNNGVRMVWAMSDIGQDRSFLEQYACANLEFDQFPMDFEFSLPPDAPNHQIFTNGGLFYIAKNHWTISFPEYFTSSSFYFHITNRAVAVARGTHPGIERPVPITVYAASSGAANDGLAKAKRVMAELEATYGPYAHRSMTAYIVASGGGMEHVGATITSLGALDHEITHSWFARGVMPADGNSGWIDESIASWRDNGYPRGTASTMGSPSMLSGFSEFYRLTPMASYSAGATLMSRFDALFAGGLRPVLRKVFDTAKRTPVSTPRFQSLLENAAGRSTADYFRRYVFGGTSQMSPFVAFRGLPLASPFPAQTTRHPRPLSRPEIVAIR